MVFSQIFDLSDDNSLGDTKIIWTTCQLKTEIIRVFYVEETDFCA